MLLIFITNYYLNWLSLFLNFYKRMIQNDRWIDDAILQIKQRRKVICFVWASEKATQQRLRTFVLLCAAN